MNAFKNMNDPILREDIEQLALSSILEELEENASILLTGASGLICSKIVRALALHSQLRNKNFRIIAQVRNEEKANKVLGDLIDAGAVSLCVGDITEPLLLAERVDYIIHGASATSSRYFVEKPVETIITTLKGTQNILEFARQKKVKKLIYLSSLEVYGTPDKQAGYIKETDFGSLDPMLVRSSYSEGKRMAECMCVSYAKEYGVPVVVARLSQTFGPGVSYNDGRVFAEFARCAIEGRNIVLHTKGQTLRTYCYLRDAINALFCLMLRGESGRAYNITNMETAVTIRDMAEMVCRMFPGIEVIIDIPDDISSFGYNPEMIIRLDSSALQALGWKPEVGMEEMFARLIESMKTSTDE